MRRLRFVYLAPRAAVLVLALLSPLAAYEGEAAEAQVLESFAVGQYGDLMVVPIRVGDRTIPCLVDTGATNNVFDVELRTILGKPQGSVTLESAGGRRKVAAYHAPDARLGHIALERDEPVLLVDLAPWRKLTGLEIRGVLGMAALRRHIVRFDFDRGAMEILEAAAETPTHWGRPLPLQTDADGLRYYATLSLGGVDREFLLDTGASTITIDGTTARDLVTRSEAHRMADASSLTVDGAQRESVYGLRSLTVGPCTHRRVTLWQSGDRKLGLSFLSCYRVVFDFPRRVMYLEPGSRFGDDDRIDTAGLEIDAYRGRIEAAYVWNGGPAWRAGLRAGGRLVKVGDREAPSYDLYALRHLFDSAGPTPISIAYLRSGRLRESTLTADDPADDAVTTGRAPKARETPIRTVAPVRRLLRR